MHIVNKETPTGCPREWIWASHRNRKESVASALVDSWLRRRWALNRASSVSQALLAPAVSRGLRDITSPLRLDAQTAPQTRGPAQPTGQAEGSNHPPPLPLKPSQPSKGSPVSAQPPPTPSPTGRDSATEPPAAQGLGPSWVLLFSSRVSPVSSPRSFPTRSQGTHSSCASLGPGITDWLVPT